MPCKKCGASINPQQKFCLQCGEVTPFAKPASADTWQCACGEANPSARKFCKACGKPATAAASLVIESAVGQEWDCHCGTRNPEHKKFCAGCGAAHGATTAFVEPAVSAIHTAEPAVVPEQSNNMAIESTVIAETSSIDSSAERVEPKAIVLTTPPSELDAASPAHSALPTSEFAWSEATIPQAKPTSNTPQQGGKKPGLKWLIALLVFVSLAGGAGWWFLHQSGVSSGAASTPLAVVSTTSPTAQPTAIPTPLTTAAPTAVATETPAATVAPTEAATSTPATSPKATRSPKPTRTPKPTREPKVSDSSVEKTTAAVPVENSKPQDVCANLSPLVTQQCRSCQGKTGFTKTLCFETTKLQFCLQTNNASPECKPSVQDRPVRGG